MYTRCLYQGNGMLRWSSPGIYLTLPRPVGPSCGISPSTVRTIHTMSAPVPIEWNVNLFLTWYLPHSVPTGRAVPWHVPSCLVHPIPTYTNTYDARHLYQSNVLTWYLHMIVYRYYLINLRQLRAPVIKVRTRQDKNCLW